MGYILAKVGESYNIDEKLFKCDTAADRLNIPLTSFGLGDVCYIIENGAIYIANSDKQWILQGA